MSTDYTYFLILAASLAGPLALSFDKKVAYHTKWKFLFPAILVPALFFLVWDELKTRSGVWSFSSVYTTGIRLSSLPLEEVLFFFVVPYCCVFIYECVICYFPGVKYRKWGKPVLVVMGILFIFAAVVTFGKNYTFYTALFNAIFIFFLIFSAIGSVVLMLPLFLFRTWW